MNGCAFPVLRLRSVGVRRTGLRRRVGRGADDGAEEPVRVDLRMVGMNPCDDTGVSGRTMTENPDRCFAVRQPDSADERLREKIRCTDHETQVPGVVEIVFAAGRKLAYSVLSE